MDPRQLRKHVGLGTSLLQREAYLEALDEFWRAGMLAMDELHGHEGTSETEFLVQRLGTARGMAQTALERDGANTEARLCVAVLSNLLEDYETGMRQLHQVIQTAPQLAEAHFALGTVRLHRGDQGALEELQSAVELAPDKADHRAWYGVALTQAGEPTRAVEQLFEAARIRPEDGWIRMMYGLALSDAGQTESARCELEAAVAADPQMAGAYNGLGHLFASDGDVDSALQSFERATKLHPFSQQFQRDLGEALIWAGRETEGETALRRADGLPVLTTGAARDPRSPRSAGGGGDADEHIRAGHRLAAAGDHRGALSEYGAAVESAPDYALAHHALAVGLFHVGDYERSARAAADAVALDPSNPEVHLALAYALYQFGDDREALAECREVLRLRPDCREAKDLAGASRGSINSRNAAEGLVISAQAGRVVQRMIGCVVPVGAAAIFVVTMAVCALQ